MERQLGNQKARQLLSKLVAESSDGASTSEDSGCICEIDLSQTAQVKQVMNDLHARLVVRQAKKKITISSDEERKGPDTSTTSHPSEQSTTTEEPASLVSVSAAAGIDMSSFGEPPLASKDTTVSSPVAATLPVVSGGLGKPEPDILPLLYVKNFSNGKVLERWAVQLQQTVAAKYLVVKTFDKLQEKSAADDYTQKGLAHGQFLLYGEPLDSVI